MLRAELLHERKLEAKALRRLRSEKRKHAAKSYTWKQLGEHQDNLKQNYLVWRKSSTLEQDLLRKAKASLGVLQKKSKSSYAGATREKQEREGVQVHYEAMYNKGIRLETAGKQLLREINLSKAKLAKNRKDSRVCRNNIQNLDNVQTEVNANISKVRNILNSSVKY